MFLPPPHVSSQVAGRDSKNCIDAVLYSPVESVKKTSLIQEGYIRDDQRQDLDGKS
jgi:hypothetical protein